MIRLRNGITNLNILSLSWNACLCPPEFHMLKLNPRWDSIKCGVFGKLLGHEAGAFMMELVPL